MSSHDWGDPVADGAPALSPMSGWPDFCFHCVVERDKPLPENGIPASVRKALLSAIHFTHHDI
jgi:hypothetical protein